MALKLATKIISYFKFHPIVRAYIISESFLWSASNAVTPIFAIFIVNDIPGGSIEIAGYGYSIYLISRVISELAIGKTLTNSSNRRKFLTSVIGISLMSVAYIGFIFSKSIYVVFLFYGLLGSGLGIASPAKNSLFSANLDNNKETRQWAMYDAVTFFSMAVSAAIGGFITKNFGFSTLFTVAAVVNLLGVVPYIYKRKLLPQPS